MNLNFMINIFDRCLRSQILLKLQIQIDYYYKLKMETTFKEKISKIVTLVAKTNAFSIFSCRFPILGVEHRKNNSQVHRLIS